MDTLPKDTFPDLHAFIAKNSREETYTAVLKQWKLDEALIKAAEADDVEAAKEALALGANIDAAGGDHIPALSRAIMSDSPRVVELLLAKGARIDAEDLYDRKPIHFAALSGNAKAAELLIEKGASPNSRDAISRTPLIMAATSGHMSVVKALVEAGANLADIDNMEGWCAFDYLVFGGGDPEIAQYLRAAGSSSCLDGL